MTKNLKLELIESEIVYCVTVPIKQFIRLLRRESEDPGINHCTLSQDLEAVEGVREVNYDGHFGNSVFVRVDADYNNDVLKEQVIETIAEHLAITAKRIATTNNNQRDGNK